MLATAEEQEELEAALEDEAEDVVDLSQQMETLTSPSKPPAKKPKKSGEGGSSLAAEAASS